MRGRRLLLPSLLSLSVVLLLLGAWEAFSEVRPIALLGVGRASQFDALATGSVPVAASEYSQSVVLDACIDIEGSVYGRVQPTERRMQFLTGCETAANATLAIAPASSQAWLVKALAAAERSDTAELNADYVRSRELAANVHWLASIRVALAGRQRAALDDAATTAYIADLGALLDSYEGIVAVVETYVRNEGSRDDIKQALASAKPNTQRSFLDLLDQRVSGRSE